MGSGPKGQSQQNTNTYQTQTYAPNQSTIDALNAALGKAQGAASNPFSLPVAPVAGFSQDQQNAFNTVNNSQGIGNPYLQQASNYYSPNGAQQFYNPAVDAVTKQMKDVFGAQASQNNANLTQAAGGVGADRIGVGQADLAHQQDLAAGQTYAGLWNSAVGQSQAAGQGALATGNQAFNQAFGGAQQQLGTGGLQQQLQQAQMNAPYQWDVARAAFPYQQSNFLTNATASLAPGFGGTTSGYGNSAGTSTPAQPSMFSQLLGAGVAGAGLYGGFNSGSGLQNDTSPGGAGIYNPGTSAAADAQNDALSDAGLARGGVAHFDDGGAASPYGATSVSPINIAGQSIIPQAQTQRIAPHIPQIDLSPPKQSSGSSSSGPSFGDIAGTAMKIGMMFANRGGSVSPENMRTFDGHDPDAFFARGGYADAGVVDDEPYRMADPAAMNAWRKGVDNDSDAGTSANDLPEIIKTGSAHAPKATHALGFTATPDDAAPDVAAPAAPNPYYTTPTAPAPIPTREKGFSDSPWSALMQAGLGMMSGTSPFAGVNIGQGGMQGMKALQQQRENAQKDETTDMAARRLAQEAAHHADSLKTADRPYKDVTAYQQAQLDRQEAQDKLAQERFDRPYKELTKLEKAQLDESIRQHNLTRIPEGFREKTDENGKVVGQEPIPGGLHDPATIAAETQAKQSVGGFSDSAVEVAARQAAGGDQSWAKNLGRGAQGGRDLTRVRNRLAEILTQEQGMDPQKAAQFVSNATKEWTASQIAANAGARTRGNREAQLDMILQVADAAVPAALEASAKVNRTRWVPLNSIIQKGQVMTSDPDLQDFGIANLQLAEGWARAMNPTGVMRESDRDKALEYLGTKTSQETYKRGVRQIQKQIQREKDAISKGHSSSSNTRGEVGDMPSPQAIEMLNSDPAKYRKDFEQRYGKGSVDRFLAG